MSSRGLLRAVLAVGVLASTSNCYAGPSSPAGGTAPSNLDQQIDQAVNGHTDSSASDTDDRIKDLESTRTAIDQKKKPTVSLDVSGWVNQQVQYNVGR
jgi:hypothetical protein